MNRRKLIYFLSAFVLIIGCYALNLSYSLFTATASSEGNIVESTVPVLNATLEKIGEDNISPLTNSVSYNIPANSSKVVRLRINNSSNIDMRYSISIDDLKGTTVQLVEGYNITKEMSNETTQKDVLLYVTNPNDGEINDLTFKLELKYLTLGFNESDFIASSYFKKKEDGTLDTVRVLNNEILVRAMDTSITDENKTVYDENFDISNDITGISGASERKLIKAEDDYGTSYVFRGAVKDNYVKFADYVADFTWRIVRINGDGSVRLIFDGFLERLCEDYSSYDSPCYTYAGKTTAFNVSDDDNAYVGYMYGFTGGETNKCLTKDSMEEYTVDSSEEFTTEEDCKKAGGRWAGTPYETTHINKNSSTIKTKLDTFYESYIKYNEKYLSDTMFCGDKSLASSGIAGVTTQLGTGTNRTYYAAVERLYYSGTTLIKTAKPTLMCANNANDDYSRYSVDVQTLKSKTPNGDNKTTNGDLKYPIALLSADEVVLAGGFRDSNNYNYYLHIDNTFYTYWWLLTPSRYNGEAYEFTNLIDFSYSYSGYMNYFDVESDDYYSRPVINLKADLLLESGDGTKSNPYVIKEIVE